MKEFRKLQDEVESGRIRLINMIGIPRSVSTALGRSLNETAERSIFINEPFNRNNRSLEVAAIHILGVIDAPDDQVSPRTTVFVKNMATYMGAEDYQQLTAVSDAAVWSVRDPLIQIGSLATRIANDIALETGADTIAQSDLAPYLEDITSFLADSDLSTNFSRTGWEAIGNHFHSDTQPNQSIVVDGGEFVISPHNVLKNVSQAIGLAYDERMVEGWQSNYTNVNTRSSRFDTQTNAWTKQAANSSGVVNIPREPLDLVVLPDQLRQHIIEVAIPTYKEMVQK